MITVEGFSTDRRKRSDEVGQDAPQGVVGPLHRRHLDALGVGPVRRVRMALSNPDAGWQPVSEGEMGRQDTAQRAPAGVDVFEGLP